MKTVEIKHYANGNKESEIEYLNGKRHGSYQAWRENGQRWEDSNWDHGKKHGRYQDWWSDGDRWEDTYYINGDICSKAEWEEHNFPKPECDLTNCSDDVLIAELKRRMK